MNISAAGAMNALLSAAPIQTFIESCSFHLTTWITMFITTMATLIQAT